MSLADELWDGFSFQHDGVPLMMRGAFEAAIKEYGEAVRKRDAELCRGKAANADYIQEAAQDAADQRTGYDWAYSARTCAAAIEREPLP